MLYNSIYKKKLVYVFYFLFFLIKV